MIATVKTKSGWTLIGETERRTEFGRDVLIVRSTRGSSVTISAEDVLEVASIYAGQIDPRSPEMQFAEANRKAGFSARVDL